MKKYLTFALKEDKLTHISDVENGLACGCICPECKLPLVAKNNTYNKKTAHFAHYLEQECAHAYETALHLLAKSILLDTKKIRVPDFHFNYDNADEQSKFKIGQVIVFDDVRLEYTVMIDGSFIRPDAVGFVNGKEVYIEFANTHFIDFDKLDKIKKSDKACIEINLSNQELNIENLTAFFQSASPDIYWISNPRLDHEYLQFLEQKKAKEENDRQVSIQREKQRRLERVEEYQTSKEYEILPINQKTVHGCPMRLNAIKWLQSKYIHPIVKEIKEGASWNRKIYKDREFGEFIYFKEAKIYLMQSESSETNLSGRFYYGLKNIVDSDRYKTLSDCKVCDYYVDMIDLKGKPVIVCCFKSLSKDQMSSKG